jgi:hypothetical protein
VEQEDGAAGELQHEARAYLVPREISALFDRLALDAEPEGRIPRVDTEATIPEAQ